MRWRFIATPRKRGFGRVFFRLLNSTLAN